MAQSQPIFRINIYLYIFEFFINQIVLRNFQCGGTTIYRFSIKNVAKFSYGNVLYIYTDSIYIGNHTFRRLLHRSAIFFSKCQFMQNSATVSISLWSMAWHGIEGRIFFHSNSHHNKFIFHFWICVFFFYYFYLVVVCQSQMADITPPIFIYM